MGVKINDYIQFMGLNSKQENLYLLERSAPTPEEKEIIKEIPFMNGSLDFSMLLGERVFKNREIEYTFLLLDSYDRDIFEAETRIKKKVMPYGRQKLFDTHDPSHYWIGKCKSVTAERDDTFSRLRVTIVFDCYPFMLRHGNYFDDVFDRFDFNNDVACFTKYDVQNSLEFVLVNPGNVSLKPEIIASSNLKVTINGETANFLKGTSKDYYLSLKPGVNKVAVKGTGTISFRYQIEVMG